jgi:hypothetical protein
MYSSPYLRGMDSDSFSFYHWKLSDYIYSRLTFFTLINCVLLGRFLALIQAACIYTLSGNAAAV